LWAIYIDRGAVDIHTIAMRITQIFFPVFFFLATLFQGPSPKNPAFDSGALAPAWDGIGFPDLNYSEAVSEWDALGPDELDDLRGAEPVSISTTDLDGDGALDLVVGFRRADGGLLVSQLSDGRFHFGSRASARSIPFNGRPLEGRVTILETSLSPDYLATGDFDGDGAADVAVASQGGNRVDVYSGNRAGRFLPDRPVWVRGRTTALASGDINRRDGKVDLLIGVDGENGSALKVVDSRLGIFDRSLSMPPTQVASRDIDGDGFGETVVLQADAITVFWGVDTARPAEVIPAVRSTWQMDAGAVSMAVGDFVGDPGLEILALGADGFLTRIDPVGEETMRSTRRIPVGKLEDGRYSTTEKDDLRLETPQGVNLFRESDLNLLFASARPEGSALIPEPPLQGSLIRTPTGPGAIGRLRYNPDAMSDLVFVQRIAGSAVPRLMVLPSKPRISMVVTRDTFEPDANLGDEVCDVDLVAGGPQCSFRAAIQEANALGGGHEIRFAIGLVSAAGNLPAITAAVSILGQEQVVLKKSLALEGGNSTLTQMAVQSAGIRFRNANNNVVAASYFGTGLDGGSLVGGVSMVISNSAGNLIGGGSRGDSCQDACNIFVGQGLSLSGSASTGNTIAGNFFGVDKSGSTRLDSGLQEGSQSFGVGSLTVVGNVAAAGMTHLRSPGSLFQGNYVGTDATGTVALSQQSVVDSGDGLWVGGDNITIGGQGEGLRNVLSGNKQSGLLTTDLNNGLVEGNFIGVDASGSNALGNLGFSGAAINSVGGTVGGTTAAAGNVISGNAQYGLDVRGESAGLTISGNFIGTDRAGTKALPNGLSGILLGGDGPNIVGGSGIESGNVIAGNLGHGILVVGGLFGMAGHMIIGNHIGVTRSLASMGNGGAGISNFDGIVGLQVGGDGANESNFIAHNALDGVLLDAWQGTPTGVTVRSNDIWDNGGLGINLHWSDFIPAGPNPNDPGDADNGPNGLLNYPDLFLEEDDAPVLGVLSSAPGATFTIELFKNDGCDPSGYGEGEQSLGTLRVTTDASGSGTFETNFIASIDDNVSATATDAAGNTSEFSLCATSCALSPDSENRDLVCPTSILVNRNTDEPDADLGDGVCDTDLAEEDSQCTLRAAIQTANQEEGSDRIEFDIGSGVPEIVPNSPLPSIDEQLAIDGHSRDAQQISISGENLTGGSNGLEINAGAVSVKGLRLHDFQGDAILMNSVAGVRIGGPQEREGNYLFSNSTGIVIRSAESGPDPGPFIEGNFIGVSPDDHDTLVPNQNGGIKIEAAGEVYIGGETEETGNLIMDGIAFDGLTSFPVRVRNNELGVPPEWLTGVGDDPFRLPIDAQGDGLTCLNLGDAVSGVATPHIADLSTSGVLGFAEPGSIVQAHRVLELGTDRGRYLARRMEWVGADTADATGAFDMPLSLSVGDRIVVHAESVHGSLSEPTQARYPLIAVAGIGGSWIEANDFFGTELWLPDGTTDGIQNANMARMIMDIDGVPIESSGAASMIESVFGLSTVYGPMMAALEAGGWLGDSANADSSRIDLWRFWYDWRRPMTIPHAQLTQTVGKLTQNLSNSSTAPAVSCQVDMVAHSMGGLVASSYVKQDLSAAESPAVHRFVTMAAPYLGTPQVVAGHTFGYIFGLEEMPLFGTGWDVDWNIMLNLTDNMGAAYMLMPSRNYYPASQVGGLGLLPDFNNNPLRTYDAVSTFLTGRRATGSGANLGLERNARLWPGEQTWHNLIDDWRSWIGPPQVFRIVGNVPLSTSTAWFLANRFQQEDGTRSMAADPRAVIEYRNRLAPIQGAGDGTVSIESSSLGRIGGGSTDFSGVHSPWIEDFEEYPCLHMDIVNPGVCSGSVERAMAILRSGTVASSAGSLKRIGGRAMRSDAVEEVFYVLSSAPVAVTAVDASGRLAGSVHPDTLGKISYAIPGVRFTSTGVTSVMTLPVGSTYTVTAIAPERETTVQLFRLDPSGDQLVNNLFPDQVVQRGGGIRWTVDPAGDAGAIEVDVGGDGNFAVGVTSTAVFNSTSAAPAIPIPEPLAVDVEVLVGDGNPVATIVLPEVGGPAWTWEASTSAGWISANAAGGRTPSTLSLTLDAVGQGVGSYADSVAIRLSMEGYTIEYNIPVEIGVSEAAAVEYLLVTPREAELLPGETQQFGLEAFDQFRASITASVTWTASGGSIDAAGLLTAGDKGGVFEVRATDTGSGVFDSAALNIPSLTGLEENGELPTSWELYPVFPNPFNPVTSVLIDVPEPGEVHVQVFDMLGRRVRVLIGGHLDRGRHRLVFDAHDLPSGIYVVQAAAAGFRKATTAVMLK
jgi:CSLREA domain-containing protein